MLFKQIQIKTHPKFQEQYKQYNRQYKYKQFQMPFQTMLLHHFAAVKFLKQI